MPNRTNFLRNIEEYILVIILFGLVLTMSIDIILRYVFNGGFTWSEEFNRFIFAESVFLSCGYVVRKKCMFRMTAIQEKLPLKVRFGLELFIDVVLIVFFCYWSYAVIVNIKQYYKDMSVSSAMLWPYWILFSFMALGFFLGVLASVQKLITDIKAGPACMISSNNEYEQEGV